MKLILIIFFSIFAITSFSQFDTVIVWLDSTDCTPRSVPYSTESPKPYQRIAKGKNGGGYIDSIRVCNQSIGFDTSQYYLIVYSIDSLRILEGDFYGIYSNGKIIEYDRWGRKIFEGENELRLSN